jgi:hypothetical protein
LQFFADQTCARDHRPQLAHGNIARQILHAAVRGDDEVPGATCGVRRMRAATSSGVSFVRRQSITPEQSSCRAGGTPRGQVRLRGLDRDLRTTAARELRQERVRRTPSMIAA